MLEEFTHANSHTFLIPVMGTGFTIDTPIKVAQFGIDSVISLVDDVLVESARKYHCKRLGLEYSEIGEKVPNQRAKRITAYLDLINQEVEKQAQQLRYALENGESTPQVLRYFELLPNSDSQDRLINIWINSSSLEERRHTGRILSANYQPGEIQVNIMTKLDGYKNVSGASLSEEQLSDALGALKGFADSSLSSTVVLSAGVNQRLFTFLSEQPDFLPHNGCLPKKKVALKVNDYRSALLQGKLLAKQGVLVSQFRVESGLNCGGHAFSKTGKLLGPVLEEFKTNRTDLQQTIESLYTKTLMRRGLVPPQSLPKLTISVGGGIGTHAEDSWLRKKYEIDYTAWGTPFLLCPEVTQVDPETLQKLLAAREQDVILSDSSPLGVGFNNLVNSESELQRIDRANSGKAGAPCLRGLLANNTEFTIEPICVASRQYQYLKLQQIKDSPDLTEQQRLDQTQAVTAKSCICKELGDGALRNFGDTKARNTAPAVCPGPNIAYFSKQLSLEELVQHIYGKKDILEGVARPHMLIKELELNLNLLTKNISEACGQTNFSSSLVKQINDILENIRSGIEYYESHLVPEFTDCQEQLMALKEITNQHAATIQSIEQTPSAAVCNG